jgi:hypothetical protein
MKIFAAAIFLTALAATSAQAQPAPGAGKSGLLCLRPFDAPGDPIIRTHVVDRQTILFYMRNGKIWKNTLKGPCPGLTFHGFAFMTPEDEVCENSQGIQVIKTGEVCQLGAFTPYTALPSTP